MQHTVQKQLIDELSQLCETLDSAEAYAPCEKPAATAGRPRSALELARATPKLGTRHGRAKPVREQAQGILPLLDE